MRVGGFVNTQLLYDLGLLVWRWLHVSAVLGHLQFISSFTINNNTFYIYNALTSKIPLTTRSRWKPLIYSKGKAVPLQACSGPDGSRKLRFPHFMTTAQDGGKVVSLTHRPPLPPGNTPGTNFCWRLSRPQGHSATGRIISMKNSSDNIGNRTRDLPVCSVVP